MRALLIIALVASGCATTKGIDFVSNETLKFDATKYPDDAALVLYRSDGTELIESGNESWTHHMRHEAFAVLGEGGFDLAEVRVPMWNKSKLLRFNARVVQPDGTTQTFDGEQMLSESGGKGEHDTNMKFFRFPDVRVGSICEFAYVIRTPGFFWADDQDTLGNFPVRHYEFELTAAKPIVLETIEFNGGAPIQVRTLGDGRHQLRFELDNLPPRRDADYAPHWTFTEPRWAWRAVAYQQRAYREDLYRDWKDVVESRGRAFFVDGKLEEGLSVPLDVKDCADVKCKAERAMKLLVERTTTRGVKWNREAKLSSALESGKASKVERALLLKFLLAREGIDVWLGYGTGKLSQQTSPTFPRMEQFDHLFVYLPAQKGLEMDVAIDPSCDYCKVGQLPEWFQRTPVFVFKTKPEISRVDTIGRWINVNEEDPVPSRFVVTHKAELQPNGTVNDQVTVRTSGDTAQEYRERLRTWKAGKLQESEQGVANRASTVAAVESATWAECTESTCGWDLKLSFPHEASADGQRWLVPTTVLRPMWERSFVSPSRELDVHFNRPEQIEETYELKVPAGLELVEVPKPVTITLDGFSAEVGYEKTPTGVRMVRKSNQDVGVIAKNDYSKLREAIEAFRRGRREVLVFAPRK